MQVYKDIIQGSPEWDQLRLGRATASNFGKVLAKGDGKSRMTYMEELVTEFDEGVPTEHICTKHMKAGTEKEPLARRCYEQVNSCKVDEVGFIVLNDFVGGSPDGLVGKDGIIEIKCPLSSTHVETILSEKMPTKHIPQVQGLLWVTGRQWCDFISFDPKVLSRPIFCIRIERDKDYIATLAGNVAVFVKELKEMVDKIKGDF